MGITCEEGFNAFLLWIFCSFKKKKLSIVHDLLAGPFIISPYGITDIGCFHGVMWRFLKLFSVGFSCYLSPIRVWKPPHSQGNLISKQWCVEMWRSWVKGNLNRWLSYRATPKRREQNWSPMKLVASGCPEENSQNVYELDLSVFNQVKANGETLMNLASIGKAQSS